MLAYIPREFIYLDTLAKIFIIAARQNQLNQENILQPCSSSSVLLLQWIQTLRSLDLIAKIRSGVGNLISDKLEYSEEVNQL